MSTQPSDGTIETVPHEVHRLTIHSDSPEGFRKRYKQAVPVFQNERFEGFVNEGVRLADQPRRANHSFILYWIGDDERRHLKGNMT